MRIKQKQKKTKKIKKKEKRKGEKEKEDICGIVEILINTGTSGGSLHSK
jgi:hypothetical protein